MDRLLKGLVTVYHSPGAKHIIFTKDGAHLFENFESDVIRGVLTDSSIWYLSDTIPHLFVTLEAGTNWMVIQASSPKKENFHKWRKEFTINLRYMYLWTWEELVSARYDS